MRFENGKIVLETRKCHCDNGTTRRTIYCPNDGKTQRGKKCEHCGTKSKYHSGIGFEPKQCDMCKGTCIVPETVYDSITQEMWDQFEFRVVRNGLTKLLDKTLADISYVINPSKSLFSCQDYGTAFTSNDATIIEEVKKSRYHQACNLVDENGNKYDYIAILIGRGGYTVLGMMEAKQQAA